MRLIDADALKANYVAIDYIITGTTSHSLCHQYVSLEDINRAPTIEPKFMRHGKWKRIKAYPGIIFCDECGEPFEKSNSNDKWNYCPNCGAKMEEGNDKNSDE